ncbi:MAG: hypothetical protein IK077_14260 [Thermoguttaceae bacterium]|nr:hypothetical protein [Thermoguttaceae bacterium]
MSNYYTLYHKVLTLVLGTFGALTILCATDAYTQEATQNVDQLLFHVNSSPNYLPTDSQLNVAESPSVEEIRSQFANPGTDFATSPLWVWNDLLTEDQVRSTLADLNRQNVNMAFVHPRPGLATPYLSDDWFRLWDATLDEASKRGMKVWIYDENSYPSGFAGGYVPDAMPESRGSGLNVEIFDSLVDEKDAWKAGQSVIYVVEQLQDGSTIDRTKEILDAQQAGKPIPGKSEDGMRWIIGRVQLAGPSQWYGGKTYVNLMTKGVLDAFVGFTHEEYRRRLGDKFGNLIPGAFTDEPQVASAGMFSWTADFPEEFKNRRGYDLIPCIGSLIEPIGEWKKVRYDYYKTVLEVFIERWHKPLAEYCESVGLEYTGHDWEHEWPNAHHCPDNMATAFWRQRPAIDLLMNNFSRGTHAQFGNVRSVRELNSATRQAGRCRSISENYGAGGYDIQFEDLKRLGDWSYALGVNTTCEHLSYISIRGARKHDHPQTFSYHSPWFEQYSKLEDYWTRLSYLLSRGQLSRDRVLIIEPTSTTWLYQANAGAENNGKKDRIGDEFANFLNKLEAAQLDYDLGSEDIIIRVGNVKDGKFVVGAATYTTVVLPDSVETLDAKTLNLLARFTIQGGRVVSLNAPLSLVAGRDITAVDERSREDLTQVKNAWTISSVDELIESYQKEQAIAVQPSYNAENVFHQLRETQNGAILFVCNIDLVDIAEGEIVLDERWKSKRVDEFDPLTGEIKPYSSAKNDRLQFQLSPCSSLSLVFSDEEPIEMTVKTTDKIKRLDPWSLSGNLVSVKPCDDNVLVLDYMTVKVQNDSIENEYFYRANGWFWKKKGYPMSPWDNGVQFKDELISKRFDDESGFELIYKFKKSDAVVDDLRFVVENPDMFDVYCNDQKIERIPDAWKFDRSFGVFDISKTAKPGENEIKLVATKSTIFTELMPAWIVGSFSLNPTSQGFEIVADRGLSFKTSSEKVNKPARASSAAEKVVWLSSGVNFSDKDDRAPSISFQFQNASTVKAMRVWNYCETNLACRGIRTFEIKATNADGSNKELSGIPATYELRLGDSLAEVIEFPKELTFETGDQLSFVIKSNWNGIEYPLPDSFVGTTKADNDNAFVGLAEVQFLDSDSNIVKVEASASSELVYRSHNRRAQFAVDGSGLEVRREGWASQGRPFYAGAVDYQFKLNLTDLADQEVCFDIPDIDRQWRGSVAAVLFNDEQIGVIGWEGENVNLSSAIKKALDEKEDVALLTVRIYGTPKNLFGPHHAGQLRGSAWPGSFHGAPSKQPAGTSYDVIEYGLYSY